MTLNNNYNNYPVKLGKHKNMTPPPLLLGCTLLFWGWQSQLLPFAMPMAIILEAARWIGWRWKLSDKDFNHITDFTSLSLIVAALYLINQYSIHGLMTLLKGLPILFFLLIAIQTYSTDGTIKLSSLFLSLRHGKPHPKANQRINLTYPYMMICLLSSSLNNTSWYFLGICVLIAWGLWAARPQRYPIAIFGILLAIAGTLGYIGQLGIYRLHTKIEELMLNWFEKRLWADRDPYRQNTAIGDIGRLKLSDKIILRVNTPKPLLLREVSYNTYYKTIWLAKPAKLTEETYGTWTFTNEKIKLKKENSPKISAYLRKGEGMLALPHGTYQITNLSALSLQRNNFGAIKIKNGPGLINYTAHFAQKTPLDTPPAKLDLYLHPRDKAYLTELSNKLNLAHQSPQQVLNTLSRFFNQNFQYTLKLSAPTQKNLTPLEDFLRHRRAGHCEYFATATALLLRTAGIPSRYAVGYAVIEYSQLENAYIVRKRHAHAWTLAYIDGRWQEFDTTPATWVNIEQQMATWWEPINDLWSYLSYQLTKWRWRDNEQTNDWLLWLILPLGLILIWRLYTREKIARSDSTARRTNTAAKAGSDSPFYQIVRQLNASGYTRQQGETLTTWIKRIQMLDSNIQTMLTLHQRYRFDPAGITPQDKAILTTHVKAWLENTKTQCH
jgi:transglutaminase-like putative cysteine protease